LLLSKAKNDVTNDNLKAKPFYDGLRFTEQRFHDTKRSVRYRFGDAGYNLKMKLPIYVLMQAAF
jgi:hypothetical protein